MAQWVLYLDETGSPDPHAIPVQKGTTPVFTLGGVILPIDRWREYDRAYLYLKREFFAAEIDRSSKIDCVWEAKGNELLAPRNAASERNKVFCYRVIALIKQFGGRVLGVTFIKSFKKPMSRTSMYTKGLQILAERFDVFLREDDSAGMLVLDSRMAHTKKGQGLDFTVAISYLSFVFGNRDGQQLRRIVEAPMFADSGLTAGLQIADIVAAMISTNAYCDKLAPNGAMDEFGYLDYTHVKRYWKPLREVVFESVNLYGGSRFFGIRTLDHSDAQVPQAKLIELAAHFKKGSA